MARVGMLLQLGILAMPFATSAMMFRSFSQTHATGQRLEIDLDGLILLTAASVIIASVGWVFLLIALFVHEYRSDTFVVIMWILSLVWIPFFPVGTAVSVLVIYKLVSIRKRGLGYEAIEGN